MKKVLILILAGLVLFPSKVSAKDLGMGVHLLHPDELYAVLPIRGSGTDFFVTVPYSLSDKRTKVWNDFFESARENKITPILRLTTSFDTNLNSWRRPTKRDIVDAANYLTTLDWRGERIVILFNEPNHAAEWGGKVDPKDYAERALFTASWFHTQPGEFVVLPAGLDAAAPNSATTMDSFSFWRQAFAHRPDLVNWINGWTSHSYPNPGFVGSAFATGKASLRGFEEELVFLRSFSKSDLPVYITETGWRQTRQITPLLTRYYEYAYDHVWSHPQVRAVTVFLFQGSPGPFAEFSLLTPGGMPTPQLDALRNAMNTPDF